MKAYLPFLVIGLTAGSVYALAAMGLVVTYTTSGVFNFAHGAVAMIATFIFYSLRITLGVPTILAAAIVIGVVGPAIGVIIDRVLLRRLVGATSSVYVVVSLGLLVLLQGIAIVIYGPVTRPMPALFPQSTFSLPGVRVTWAQLITVLIALGSALALIALFTRTQKGLEMRAVVDDPDLTEMSGADAGAVTTLSWTLGCAFAALSGVLLSPILGVDATLLTLLVIYSFGAAAIGRLVSLPLAYAGGLGIGIVASISTKFVAQHPLFAGIPTSLPFLVLFAVLVISRKGAFAEVTKTAQSVQGRSRRRAAATRVPYRLIVALVAVAAVLPAWLSSARLTTATEALAYVLIFSSLGLLIGLSRQVSLCHAVFIVLGATTLSHLLSGGVPFLAALCLSGLILVPAAALLAIPAIRLSGLFLALATFGFGVLAQNLLFNISWVFGQRSVVKLNRPEFFGISLHSQIPFYYFVLAIVVLGVVAVEVVRVTRLGRLLRGLADSPTAIESLGINPTASRVLTFCLAGFLGAIAGGLLGTLTQTVNTQSFNFSSSLIWVAVLVAAGSETLGGAVLASVLLVALPSFFTSSKVLEYQTIGFGAAAILLAQTPNGLIGLVRGFDFAALARASSWRLDGRQRTAERAARLRPAGTVAP